MKRLVLTLAIMATTGQADELDRRVCIELLAEAEMVLNNVGEQTKRSTTVLRIYKHTELVTAASKAEQEMHDSWRKYTTALSNACRDKI